MLKQALCDALVGRDAELSALEDALLSVERDRSGGLVLLAGEAGMGKTRLAHEFADRARGARLGRAVGRLLGGRGGAAVPAVRRGARQPLRRALAGRDPRRARRRGARAQPALPAARAARLRAACGRSRAGEAAALRVGRRGAARGRPRRRRAARRRRHPLGRRLHARAARPSRAAAEGRAGARRSAPTAATSSQRRHPLLPTLQAWRRSRPRGDGRRSRRCRRSAWPR